jgi:hypothetical protein
MRANCVICGYLGSHKRKEKDWVFHCISCRSKRPPDDKRCKGVNTVGERCGHWSLHNSNYCAHHKEGEN